MSILVIGVLISAIASAQDAAPKTPAPEAIETRTMQELATLRPTSAEERKPHEAPKPNETRVLKIKELGNFDYDTIKGGTIPKDVQSLSKMSVRVTGYMIPMDQADKITQFALVPDLAACCFGAPPQIQHTIVINCPKGKAVSYYPDEIIVEGVLTVEEKKEEDFILSIFEIQAASVKPAPK